MIYISNRVSHYSVLFGVYVLALALLVQSVHAQNSASTLPGQAPGAPTGSFQLSGFDNINLFNGHLNFQLPLASLEGRGSTGFQVSLAIDSRWIIPSGQPDFAWPTYMSSSGLSAAGGGLRSRQISEECQWGSNFFTQTQTLLVFTMPDGTEVELRDAIFNGQPALSECNPFAPGTGNASRGRLFRSRDGLLTFVSDTNILDDIFAFSSVIERNVSGYLLQKNGTRHRIKDGRVEWIRDRNGNLLTFTYDPNTNRLITIKDSLNRQIDISYTHWDPMLTDFSVSYKGFGGAPRTISIQRTLLQDALIANESIATYQALFPGTMGSSTDHFNDRVVKSVTLPDNRTYQFRYNRYGELSRVELPTGGVFTYQWASGNTQSASGWEGKYINRRVIKKSIYKDATTLVGSTSFGLFETTGPFAEFGSATISQLNELDAPLTHERHYFHGVPMDHVNHEFGYSAPPIIGREFKIERNTPNGATLLQRIEYTYDGAGINITQTLNTLADVTPNLVSKQTFAYDGFFNLIDTFEFDFGSGTPGAFLRRRHTDYVNTTAYAGTDPVALHAGTVAHLRSLPLQTWISSDTAGNTKKSLTVFEYDIYVDDALHDPLTPRSNISGLCTTFDSAGVCANANPVLYTTRGNVTKMTSYTNASAQTGAVSIASQYDIAGNVVKIIDGRGFLTQFDFDDCYGTADANAQNCTGAAELGAQVSYALPKSVTNALGHVSRMQYDFYLGKPVDAADVNGVVTSVEYNDALDRTKRIIGANNQSVSVRSQTIIDYDDANKTITTSTDLNNFDDRAIVSQVLYDGLGRTKETRQYEGGTNYIATQVEYDALSRAFKTSNPFRPWEGQTPVWTTQLFDTLGRVLSVTTPDNAVASTAYSGNQVLVTDPGSKQRLRKNDALGRVKDVWEITPTDPATVAVSFPGHPEVAAGYRSTYDYDVLDNITGVTQRVGTAGSLQTRSYDYDSLKRLKTANNPESGITSYQYDNNGNLSQSTDSRVPAVTTTYIYDALNRVTNRSYSNSTPAVTYGYDSTQVSNGTGRLASVSSSVSSYNYNGYDALGRVLSSKQTMDSQIYTMGYTYDLAGNLKSQSYPSGRIVLMEYDVAARLAGVQNQGGIFYAGAPASDTTNRIDYSAHAAVRKMKLGNGLWEHTNFNLRLQPIQIGLGTAATNSSVLQLDFDYGTATNNGNLLSQNITIPGLSLTQSYTYDALNRLETAKENSGNSWKQKFLYDRFGNRRIDPSSANTSSDLVGPNPVLSELNNRIVPQPGELYLYDEAGNLKRGREGQTYEFDGDNRISSFNGGAATYSYDGDGRRVKKVVGSVTIVFVYDVFDHLVAEYSSSLPELNGTRYLTNDHLGSPRVMTDAGGVVKSRHDYHPFGEEVGLRGGRDAGTHKYVVDSLRHKFTSKERDDETGLDYFLARYYSSAQGRFTSVDPTLLSVNGFNPQTWNRYAYVLNNPLAYVDPLGLWRLQATTIYKKDDNGNEIVDSEGNRIVERVEVVAIRTNDTDTVASLAQQLGLTGGDARSFVQRLAENSNNIRLSEQRGDVGELFKTVETGLKKQAEYEIDHPNMRGAGPDIGDCSVTACRIAFPSQMLGISRFSVQEADALISSFGASSPVQESQLRSGDIVRWADDRNKPTHFATFIFRKDDGSVEVFSKSGARGPYEKATISEIGAKNPNYGTVRGINSRDTGYYHPR